jgi:2-C-methyl-D-erythritol 4-phosphate cytidylyltransferase
MYRGLKVTALVVAAGKGTRMNTNVKKQYMLLIIYRRSLKIGVLNP